MKEIKFKAWDTSYKTMLGPYEATDLFSEDNGFDSQQISRHIYLQYTGLKDKNGNEIYEGDILEDDAHWYEVVWSTNRGAWLAQVIRDTDHDIEAAEIAASRDCCKIGNIYENPELLDAR